MATVRYGGGCEEHDFYLLWDGTFMESAPVQVALNLFHNAQNDQCLAAGITEQLSFDLSPLKEAWQEAYRNESGTIIVDLDTVEESLLYTF